MDCAQSFPFRSTLLLKRGASSVILHLAKGAARVLKDLQ